MMMLLVHNHTYTLKCFSASIFQQDRRKSPRQVKYNWCYSQVRRRCGLTPPSKSKKIVIKWQWLRFEFSPKYSFIDFQIIWFDLKIIYCLISMVHEHLKRNDIYNAAISYTYKHKFQYLPVNCYFQIILFQIFFFKFKNALYDSSQLL